MGEGKGGVITSEIDHQNNSKHWIIKLIPNLNPVK